MVFGGLSGLRGSWSAAFLLNGRMRAARPSARLAI